MKCWASITTTTNSITPGIPEGQWQYFPALMVDEDFVETFEVPIIAGRNYDKDREREDSLSMLINRSMAKYLGYADPEEAINQPFKSMSGQERIIGVIEDFSFKSFHHPIGPFVIDVERRGPQNGRFSFFAKMLLINLKETSPAAIAHVENVWKKFVPNKPLAYTFLDEEIGQLYRAEQKMGFILTIFSAMAVFIACLGLFGLSSFMTAQRTKEIGIRKVLGASTSEPAPHGVAGIFFPDRYCHLVGLSCILAHQSAVVGELCFSGGF